MKVSPVFPDPREYSMDCDLFGADFSCSEYFPEASSTSNGLSGTSPGSGAMVPNPARVAICMVPAWRVALCALNSFAWHRSHAASPAKASPSAETGPFGWEHPLANASRNAAEDVTAIGISTRRMLQRYMNQ